MDRRLLEPADLPANRSSAPDFYVVLSSVIEASKDNPAQLRNLVYELARVNLKREIFVRHPLVRRADVDKQMQELEEAIERVENSSDDDRLMLIRRPLWLEAGSDERGRIGAPDRGLKVPDRQTLMAQFRPAETEPPIEDQPSPPVDRSVWPGARRALQLIGATVVVVLVVTALIALPVPVGAPRAEPPLNILNARFPDPPRIAAGAASTPGVTLRALPLPGTYGIYAVSDGRLIELDPLGMGIPDARTSMDIKEPSQIVLPNGKVSFVLFRRDWAQGTPERLSVRVTARVVREMTFKDGRALVSPLANMWRVRGNSYDLRVGPAGDKSEMVVAQPEDGLVLPPGRYALMLNGLGYDFSVAGTITDPAQCLERTETVGAAIYSECRKP